jgi:hypothetical protein
VKVSERKALQHEELTQEAREIYASAVAGTSVFADDDQQVNWLSRTRVAARYRRTKSYRWRRACRGPCPVR